MKYIDAEKLIAEIERRKNQTERRLDNIVPIRRKDTMDEEQLAKIELRDKVDKAYLNGVLITLSDILSFITSLQQERTEVDLAEELKTIRESDEWRQMQKRGTYMFESLLTVAHHFYELGLNVRKEDAK